MWRYNISPHIIGWTLKTIHALLTNLCMGSIFVLNIMPYWNFEYTKALTLHYVKVGGGIYPATEITHFGLN